MVKLKKLFRKENKQEDDPPASSPQPEQAEPPKPTRASILKNPGSSMQTSPGTDSASSGRSSPMEPRQIQFSFADPGSSEQKKAPPALPPPPPSLEQAADQGKGSSATPGRNASALAMALPPPPPHLDDSAPLSKPPPPMPPPPQSGQMQKAPEPMRMADPPSKSLEPVPAEESSSGSEDWDPNAGKGHQGHQGQQRHSLMSDIDTGSDTMVDHRMDYDDDDDFFDDGMAGGGCCTLLGCCPREEVVVVESREQLTWLIDKTTENMYADAVLEEPVDVGNGTVLPTDSRLVSCLYAGEVPDSNMWKKDSRLVAEKARNGKSYDFPMTLVFKLPDVVYGRDGKKVPRWALAVRCPCCMVLMVPLLTMGMLAACLPHIAGKTMEEIIEFDVSSFARADGNRSMTQAAMADAMQFRSDPNEEKGQAKGRRLATTLLRFLTFDNQIVYRAINGTIMLPERLKALRRFERELRNLPGWKRICSKAKKRSVDLTDEDAADSASLAGDARRCEPGRSFFNFAYSKWIEHEPTPKAFWNAQPVAKASPAMRMNFTGQASEYLPLETVLVMLRTLKLLDLFVPMSISDLLAISATASRSTLDSIQLYANSNAQQCQDEHKSCPEWALAGYCPVGDPRDDPDNADYMGDLCRYSCGMCAGANVADKIESLRSVFVFRIALTPDVKMSEAQDEYQQFLDDEFYPMINDPPEYITDEFIKIYFTGKGIQEKQILEALFGDLVFGGLAMVFVWTYLLLHTRSPFLASMGIYLIFSSIPCGFAIFTYASSGGRVTIASFLSVFLIIGIGSDMLFIYTDFWKQSLEYTRDPVERLQFTLKHAGKSTLATSFTTGMSFVANMASVLRGLREFGFFMGSCVGSAYILVLIAYPPVLILNERLYIFCKRRLPKPADMPDRNSTASPDGNLAQRKRSKSIALASLTLQRTVVYAMNPQKEGVGRKFSTFVTEKLPDYMYHGRYIIPFLFAAWTITANIWSVSLAVIDTRIPDLFPQDHNQVEGANEIGRFVNYGVGLSLEKIEKGYGGHVGVANSGLVCTNPFSVDEQCHMHQCLASEYPKGNATHCKCNWRPLPNCDAGQTANIKGYVITSESMPDFTTNNLRSRLRQHVQNEIRKLFPDSQTVNDDSMWNIAPVTTVPLLQQNWETGRRSFAAMLRPSGFNVGLSFGADPSNVCNMEYTCYCGGRSCEDAGELKTADMLLGGGSARKLQEVKRYIPAADQADVSVIIGIKVVGKDRLLGVTDSPIWEFDPTFRPEDPRVLRSILALCSSNAKDQERMKQLNIVKNRCWLEDFKVWFEEKGHRFPPDPHLGQDFSAFLGEFLLTIPLTGVRPSSDLLWIRDGKLKAMMIDYKLNISKRSGSETTFTNMALWDQRIKIFNQEISPYAEAWHISDLWVQAEAAQSVVDSTIVTFVISCSCAFMGMTIFTANPPLALIAVVNIIGVICCLTWFMVVVMQWPVGPIEVLSLIIFVGFAVDYSLHISHQYGDAVLASMDSDSSTRFEEEDAMKKDNMKRRPSEMFTIRFIDGKAPVHRLSSSSQKSRFSTQARSNSLKSINAPSGFSKYAGSNQSLAGKEQKPNMGRFSVAASRTQIIQKQSITKDQSEAIDRDPQAERFERVRFALHRMTSATLGSALTTAGSAGFLCFCTLQIFVKLGTVILIVTLLSILFALLPLPCCLMAFGPTDKGKRVVTEALTNVTDRVRHVRTHLDAASRRSSVAVNPMLGLQRQGSTIDHFGSGGFGGPAGWPKGLSWDTGEHEEPPRHFVLSAANQHVANSGKKKPPNRAALDVAG